MNLFLMKPSEIVSWYEGKTDEEVFLISVIRQLVDEEAENESLKDEIQHTRERKNDYHDRLLDIDEHIKDCVSVLNDSSKKDLDSIRHEVTKMLQLILDYNKYYY